MEFSKANVDNLSHDAEKRKEKYLVRNCAINLEVLDASHLSYPEVATVV